MWSAAACPLLLSWQQTLSLTWSYDIWVSLTRPSCQLDSLYLLYIATTIYRCRCLLTAHTYCTLSSAGLFKCWALLSTQGQEYVFIFVGCCWFAFPACNAYMVTASRPQWTVLMLLLSSDWRLRRGWAAFRHHSLKRLSCCVDGLKTETLTLQTSQSLTRLFSNIFDFIRSRLAGIIVWLVKTKLREWYLQGASIRKRKRSCIWQQL